jgi:hypothetical protein
MNAVAAYYLFIARENELEQARKRQPILPPGPSLLDRVRGLAASFRPSPRIAHSA